MTVRPTPVGTRAPPGDGLLAILSVGYQFGMVGMGLPAVACEVRLSHPRTHPVADIINSAVRSSQSWEEVWCLDL